MPHRNALAESLLSNIILAVLSVLIICLPYGLNLSSYLIGGACGLALIYRLISGSFAEFKSASWQRYARCFVPMVCLYILDLIGLTYTPDSAWGHFVLEKHLSFVAFPLLFLLVGPAFFTPKRLKCLGFVFYLACFVLIIIHCHNIWLIIHKSSLSALAEQGDWYQLFGTYLGAADIYTLTTEGTTWIHHSLEAWYILTAIALISYTWIFYPQWYKNWYLITANILLMAFFLTVGILFAGSKMGYVALTLWLITVFILLIKKRYFRWGLSCLALFIGLSALSFIAFPRLRTRLVPAVTALKNAASGQDVQKIDGSVSPRLLLWREAVAVVKEKPLFGWGTGSEKAACAQYREKHPDNLSVSQNLTPHNQMLTFSIRFGIIGLFCFLWLWGQGFWQSFQSKKYFLAIFLALTFCFAFSDEVLEGQIGIMFFCMGYGLCVAATMIGQGGTGHAEAKRTGNPEPLVSDK